MQHSKIESLENRLQAVRESQGLDIKLHRHNDSLRFESRDGKRLYIAYVSEHDAERWLEGFETCLRLTAPDYDPFLAG